ncbi:ribosome small subunit-dependent GTPase A [Bacteroidota bacterium]
MKSGIVIKTTGSWHTVKTQEKEVFECKIKGKFRIDGLVTTNPIAVGDQVDLKVEDKDNKGLITKIHKRKNYIIRKSIKLSKKAHVIAANIDKAYLIVTLVNPETSTMFIDRYLISAEAYRIPVTLLFNKVDIYDNDDKIYLKAIMNMYRSIGYDCVEISVVTKFNIDKVKNEMANKTVVVSGHSGVGKSSFINVLNSELNIKTCETSDVHQTGKHTTAYTEMFELDNGAFIIDTPGIKGFGIIDMYKEEIFHFFPEIFKESKKCKFYNCTHVHEPECAVMNAVEEHRISLSRYQNYLSIMAEDEDEKYRKSF